VDYVAPRNELEQQLVAIWQDVLAKDNIGIRHDFFELGGHSLMAIQVIARIREAFGVEMPLRQLFEQPTVAALATFLQGDTLKNAIPALVPAERGDTLPLSFSQERLWFFTQFQPEAAAYNITLTIELHGALDSDLLTQALQLLVQRHESLRTTFVAHNGIPQQVIAEQGEVCLHVVTCGEDEVEGLISAETHHAFDLSRGPLLRTTILQLNPTRQILILSMHHIISDGWSINLLFSEVTAYYAALDQGVTPQPAPLPVQYPDYAIWQRHWLQGDVLDEQLTHWQATLANAPTVLNLPTDYPRPPLQTFNGAAHFVTLPSSLTPQLEAVGKAHNATPFMTFLAAYNVLLWHLSGQDDIVVGSPIAGRDQQATEGLIGMFINTLALRTRLDTTQTFSALLAQVREATLDAYAYQAVPLAKLLDTLALERDLSRSPLFQTLFALQNTPNTPPTTLASIQIQPYQNKVYTVQADLTFTVVKIKGQWRCEWNYNTDLFAPETIEKMAALFNHLLDNIVTQAETVLTDLPALVADKLATAQEIALFDQWNDTNVPFPADKTLAQLFHEQVMNNPLGTALVFEGQSLTYARLNARANQVAHKLLQMGVSAETPIAIYLDRSFDLFIAMLAINKAGAAYLPLDANMPRERIRYMLNDAKVRIIITTAAKTMQLPAHKAAIMQLNPRWEETFTTPTNNPPTRSTAQQLANIIYTSGSTGQPKGVCVTQVGITRLVKNAPYIEFLPTDRVLQFGATTFDAATLDIWGALLNGAALYIYPSMQFDLVELATYIADNAISFAAFTPSLLHQLVDYQVDKLQSLRYLLVGGDVLSVDHADRLRQACPNTTLINAYGPTENTVDTTHYIVPKTGELGKTIPIGKPVSNTQLYILDEQLRRVALGRSGELYVGGAGVARGYLFKPELTAQAFIDNPFLKDGSKIYATGDLVRFRPNGDLEFIGRKDSQVKLRGYRIEMGEIEHALGQHPAIGSHLVTLRADDNGNKMLIAYLVATQPETPTRSELETHLQQWLPAYMVPRYFIWLDALPLTHNGKIDQRALPLPDHARPEMADQFVAPRNELEQQLAAIWQAVLSLDSVGIHDDFFDLGGHSLLATQIVARMRTALGVELSLRQLFELPTIAELADLLQHDVAPARPLAPAILPAPRDGTLPLSFSQERLWFLAQLQPDSTAYNLALAFEIQGVFDTDILGQALHLLIQRHESLRTTFTTHDDLPQQTIAEEG
ncbi:MAG TPA: amino acid adenylation domain-containing protein, partial [Anaerolineae bacterium]|nr:amino acid adenylation domain-containing protein [Anaerolineae bacterium]